MSTNNVVGGSQDNRRDDLDSRYGEIGISAVAARAAIQEQGQGLLVIWNASSLHYKSARNSDGERLWQMQA
jgi:hypothetical protein